MILGSISGLILEQLLQFLARILQGNFACDFGGQRDRKIRESAGRSAGPAAGAEVCGNQKSADFGSESHTPGTLPKAGAADLRATPADAGPSSSKHSAVWKISGSINEADQQRMS